MHNFTWDRIVRCSHWLIAISVLANLFFTDSGSKVHIFLGYLAIISLFIRLFWALTFAKFPARFRDLIPTISGIKEHWQEIKQKKENNLGHNHWGRLAIWAMWILLISLFVTGLQIILETDFYYDYSLDDVHEYLAYGLLSLIFLHIFAVIISSFYFRRNLLRAMIFKKIN